MDIVCWIVLCFAIIFVSVSMVLIRNFERAKEKNMSGERERIKRLLDVTNTESDLMMWVYHNPGKTFNEPSGRVIVEKYIDRLVNLREVLFPELWEKADELILKIQKTIDVRMH